MSVVGATIGAPSLRPECSEARDRPARRKMISPTRRDRKSDKDGMELTAHQKVKAKDGDLSVPDLG